MTTTRTTHRSTADQRKRSKAELSWVRYVVYVKSGPDAGIVFDTQLSYRGAIERKKWFAIGTRARKWAVARIEIAAGVPDPLLKRRR